jgi:hypothetical protein
MRRTSRCGVAERPGALPIPTVGVRDATWQRRPTVGGFDRVSQIAGVVGLIVRGSADWPQAVFRPVHILP